MKSLKLFPLLIFIAFIGFYCNKGSSGDPGSGELAIIKSALFANKSYSLQAIYTAKENFLHGYYFGSFNAGGEPENLREMIIHKTNGDTSVNVFFDNQQRVKLLYLTCSGAKANTLFTFDYPSAGETTVSIYIYGFDNDSSKLLYQYTVNHTNRDIISETNYATFGGSFLQILLQINTGAGVVPDQFESQLITGQGSLISAGIALSVVGGIAVGAIFSSVGLGVVAGALIANYIFSPPEANASEITKPPVGAPVSPTDQTKNTQLQTTSYYTGTSSSSGKVPFGGVIYCNYSVEYTNIAFELKLDKASQQIKSANVSATMTETIQSGCIPGDIHAETQRHTYSMGNFSIDGSSITIYYLQDPTSFPQNIAVFKGFLEGKSVFGTLTFNRTSDGLPCIVNMKINSKEIN